MELYQVGILGKFKFPLRLPRRNAIGHRAFKLERNCEKALFALAVAKINNTFVELRPKKKQTIESLSSRIVFF